MCFSAEAALARVLEHIIMKWSSNYLIFLPVTLQMPNLQLEADWFSAQWLFSHSKSIERWLLMTLQLSGVRKYRALETIGARTQKQTELLSSSSSGACLAEMHPWGCAPGLTIIPACGNCEMGTGHPPLSSACEQPQENLTLQGCCLKRLGWFLLKSLNTIVSLAAVN